MNYSILKRRLFLTSAYILILSLVSIFFFSTITFFNFQLSYRMQDINYYIHSNYNLLSLLIHLIASYFIILLFFVEKDLKVLYSSIIKKSLGRPDREVYVITFSLLFLTMVLGNIGVFKSNLSISLIINYSIISVKWVLDILVFLLIIDQTNSISDYMKKYYQYFYLKNKKNKIKNFSFVNDDFNTSNKEIVIRNNLYLLEAFFYSLLINLVDDLLLIRDRDTQVFSILFFTILLVVLVKKRNILLKNSIVIILLYISPMLSFVSFGNDKDISSLLYSKNTLEVSDFVFLSIITLSYWYFKNRKDNQGD